MQAARAELGPGGQLPGGDGLLGAGEGLGLLGRGAGEGLLIGAPLGMMRMSAQLAKYSGRADVAPQKPGLLPYTMLTPSA